MRDQIVDEAVEPWHQGLRGDIAEGLVIHEGPLVATGLKTNIRLAGSGLVRLDLASEDGLVFDLSARSNEIANLLLGHKDYEFRLEPGDASTVDDAIPADFHMQDFDVHHTTTTGDPSRLVELRFYVINWGAEIGTRLVRYADGTEVLGRHELRSEDWVLTLDRASCDVDEATLDRLRRNGHRITHCARLSKVEARDFSFDDARPILDTFRQFLALTRGRQPGIALPTGFGPEGQRVFEAWWSWRVDRGSDMRSWYPMHHPEVLEDVWPAFLDLSRHEFWSETLNELIGTYVAANEGPTDRGLVTATIGLEMLAWSIIVETSGWLRSKGFSRLEQADRMALLLHWADIPTEIPTEHGSLGELLRLVPSNKNRWGDNTGPESATWVRNCVVHPRHPREINSDHRFEAWWLSMWYFELIVLRLLGFEGQYANRLHLNRPEGTTERPPWCDPDA